MQPAIIVVAYNRPASLTRIFTSLEVANYTGFHNIQLIISIDGGGGSETAAIANKFHWKYGDKKIIIHSENLGLRQHILSCGDLTSNYDCVLILEDDCFVSSNFFRFATEAVRYYSNDNRIAGISLYTHGFNENASMPFQPLHDGNDVFFMQVPSSLGQVWTRNQWQRFRDWFDTGQVISPDDRIPENVKLWPETSWKKYFYKYIVEKDLYFVYPSVSHLTNFGDTGTHFDHPTVGHQVSIEIMNKDLPYRFVYFGQSWNKYDGFFELLPECFLHYGVPLEPDCIIDLYGTKPFKKFLQPYALSIKDCLKPTRQFGASIYPIPLNMIYNTPGSAISYARKEHFSTTDLRKKKELINNIQSLGFGHGINSILSTKEYKSGYYLLHPLKIAGLFRRKMQKLVGNLID